MFQKKALMGVPMLVAGLIASLVLVDPSPSGAAPSRSRGPGSKVSPITEVSRGCAGQNAEVEQALDPARHDVYELWMGCHGIGFARSTDGGLHFDHPMRMPGSVPSSWDPAITVAKDGTVYASFMIAKHGYTYPVVDASFDHGASFPQVSSLTPPFKQNWGDRDFIAAGPNGAVYVTWDYGPSNAAVKYICTKGGSCAFASGDLNVVVQKSTDGGKTWGQITPISPGFPASGGDSAPLVIQPDGRLDVAYQGYKITNDVTYAMKRAHTYFTSSVNGARTWSRPVRIGPKQLTMSKSEWWIDGAIGMDAGGNLYVTWDTQGSGGDIGWLSYSTDNGKTWSALRRVTPDRDNATHIVEPVGAGKGVAYVGWLSDNLSNGYAEYLRPFSIKKGWLAPPLQISRRFGDRHVWPGDTFGISAFPGSHGRVMLSWGSAVSKKTSEIFAATVSPSS